jgi:outer membrane protein assembly factor BamB
MTAKLVPVALALSLALLSACGMFGGNRRAASEAEEKDKAGRVSLSVLDQKLEPDPELAATTVTLAPATDTRDWPQVGLNAAKLSDHVQAGAEFRVAWREDIGAGSSRDKRVVSAPVAMNGRIYTIDAEQRVNAFDADRGRRVWSVELDSPNPRRDRHAVGGGLAVAGDRLIVASGFGYVAALSLADGSEIWRRRTDSPMSGSPAVLGQRLYVTSTNNELYAIDVQTGEVVWTDQAIAESARILSSPSPAATPDLMVAPYTSGELIAYLPANGRRLWTDTLTTIGRFTPLSAINDISGRPVIQDGVVYAASYSGVLTAIDARSGVRIWNVLFGSRLGPVVSGDFLFIVGNDGQVACFRKADGKVVWARELPAYENMKKRRRPIAWTGPLIASDRLVVASSTGEVIALSIQTGETVADLDLKQPIYISPIAVNGQVLVLTDEGQLVAIR